MLVLIFLCINCGRHGDFGQRVNQRWVNDILYHAFNQKNNPYHRQKPGKYSSISGLKHKNIL